MVSQALLSELNIILQEDYKVILPPTELTEVANALVGIFELLAKMECGQEAAGLIHTTQGDQL
jgi:hypothetical protein